MQAREIEHQFARERIAVRVQPRGGKREKQIARLHGIRFFQAGAFRDSDDEAREVVFPRRVEAGHFRRLAADQRASGGVAGARHSLDQLLDHVGIHFRHGQIIEEEERLGAEREDVIDAVIDEVGADRGVDVHGHGDFQLRAHAIGARDQHRLAPFFVQREQSAERTDPADHSARERARSQAPDALLGLVRKRNIHTCFGVVHVKIGVPV